MGQKLTQIKLSVAPEVETFLYKYLPQLTFVKSLSDSIFLKTALVVNEIDGEPLVCKIYFKREMNDSESKLYTKHVNSLLEIKELYNIKNSPNVAPILLVKDNLLKAGMIVRQYYSFNLKERIASMPYLTTIEKKWISFQILLGLSQIHSKGLCHCDIKLENILLSSTGSVFLGDIAPYKPAYIQQDDVGSFTYYFGTNSSIKSCYLAPERLVDKYELMELSNSIYETTTAMDIFSAGAVISELFLEDMLFDHPKLLLYKNGKYNIQLVLSKIKDKNLENILLRMMTVNPKERIGLSECLKYFADEICPISFTRMLIQINNLIIKQNYWKPDKRIGLIYKHWKQIWKVLYGAESEAPELNHNLNHQILNELILDNPFSSYSIDNYQTLFDLKNDKYLSEEGMTMPSSKFKENNNSDCSLIIVHFILTSILNSNYSSSKIVAMEILRSFSMKLPDVLNIQLIIPYLVKLLKDTSILVRVTALNEIINILSIINENELILNSSDYNFFDAYIFPSILELYSSNEPTLILAFANIIDKLTDLEQKFLQITLRSRFHNMKSQNQSIDLQASRKTFSFNINTNKDKGEEIIHAYDTDLFEFKSTLFKIIEDILSKNEDNDIQQTLIRKLPNLMLFFGRRETNNFLKFIIAHFNKKEWIIQREIMKCLPSLIFTLGETSLNQFLVPCMDLMIYNNLNELKIYEMIHTMHMLLKMEYLETLKGIELFKKILPFIMHPNLWIRNEVIEFSNTLINILSQGEVYTYLRPDFKNYLFMPCVIITKELIKKCTKERLSRVIYQLECRNIKYFFPRNEEDEVAFQFLQDIIESCKESSNYNQIEISNNSGNNSNNLPNFLEAQLVRLRASLEGLSVSSIVKKEFTKFIKHIDKNLDDIKFLERTFIGKLISLSNILHILRLPSSRTRKCSIDYNPTSDNILNQDNFKIKYLFKALNIVVKEDILDEIDKDMANINSTLPPTNLRTTTPMSSSKLGINSNSLCSWRPQGRLLSTLYDNESSSDINSFEKLLNLNIENTNKFLSFSSNGKIILWDIFSNDNDISVEKVSTYSSLNPTRLNYNKGICNVDHNRFAVATENKVELYRIEAVKSDFYIENTYPLSTSAYDDSDVCCLISNSRSNDNKILAYCNQRGKLQLYDMRVNKHTLDYDFGTQMGLVSAMDFSKDERSLYISTLGGYVLTYDFRLNSVISSYKYNDNTPIIALQSYIPTKLKEYDLYSMNINPNFNNYLLIWTAASDHEMGLWNINTLNCDMLFKVNPSSGKEIKPLTTEIPFMQKIEATGNIKELNSNYTEFQDSLLKDEKSNLEDLYKNLSLYTHHFDNIKTKRLIVNYVNSEYYSYSNKRLSKLTNLFDVTNTVQVAISPLNAMSKVGDNINSSILSSGMENVPYIISAGNDMTIRYWDITKESLYGLNNTSKRSYLINAPNKIDNCIFSTSTFYSTVILQSNEVFNSKIPKKETPFFSEYQNYNGINFHPGPQNEFDESCDVLKFCTKVSDSSHKNTITDMININLSDNNSVSNNNLLISSSWDGTIKIWK